MTIFSKIINGDIPCYKIAEDKRFFAFLDISPMAPGHTLVIPKMEVDNFWNMPADYLIEIMLFAQPIAKAIERAFPCDRCGISVIGLEVPHAHLHLVPINSANDLNFTKGKKKLTEEEFKECQRKIVEHL